MGCKRCGRSRLRRRTWLGCRPTTAEFGTGLPSVFRQGGTDQEKKVRAVLKKLRQIDDLKARLAGGETLQENQVSDCCSHSGPFSPSFTCSNHGAPPNPLLLLATACQDARRRGVAGGAQAPAGCAMSLPPTCWTLPIYGDSILHDPMPGRLAPLLPGHAWEFTPGDKIKSYGGSS